MKRMRAVLGALLAAAMLAGCVIVTPTPSTPSPGPDIQATISAAVEATIAAMPTPTSIPLPMPTPTSAPTPTATPVPTPAATATPTSQSVDAIKQLTGVWKSACASWISGGQYDTFTWTITDTKLQMVIELYDKDPTCLSPGKKFEDFVMIWTLNAVSRDALLGGYVLTGTLATATQAVFTDQWLKWANGINFHEYNNWQEGVPKDVAGKIREPGASPLPNKGDPGKFLAKVDGNKLLLDFIPSDAVLGVIIYTRQL